MRSHDPATGIVDVTTAAGDSLSLAMRPVAMAPWSRGPESALNTRIRAIPQNLRPSGIS